MFGACGSPTPLPVVDTSRVLSLDTDWTFKRSWSGVFTESDSGSEFIYSGDPVTFKKIRVFDGVGKMLYDVPLESAIVSMGDIRSFTHIGQGRWFLLKDGGTAYTMINKTGVVVSSGPVAGLCDTEGDKYLLFDDSNGPAFHEGTMYLGAYWQGACSDTLGKEFDPFVPEAYYSRYTPKCRAASIRDLTSEPIVHFGACDILPHLVDTLDARLQ